MPAKQPTDEALASARDTLQWMLEWYQDCDVGAHGIISALDHSIAAIPKKANDLFGTLNKSKRRTAEAKRKRLARKRRDTQ